MRADLGCRPQPPLLRLHCNRKNQVVRRSPQRPTGRLALSQRLQSVAGGKALCERAFYLRLSFAVTFFAVAFCAAEVVLRGLVWKVQVSDELVHL